MWMSHNRLIKTRYVLRTIALMMSLVGCGQSHISCCAEPVARNLPPHPRLVLDQAGVAKLKARIAQHPWAKAIWQSIQKSADQTLEEKVELPPRGGAYYHFYVDPEKGSPLSRGKQIAPWKWEHRAADGKIYRGDPTDPKRDYDGYACLEIHLKWTKQCRNLGLAYQVTGDEKYAQKCREILLAYASLYPNLGRRNHWGWPFPNSGKIATHMLSEALWLIPAVQGADLVWDTIAADDQRRIANKIFRPCVDQILLPQDSGLHNRQCWKNSAVGLVGFLLNDESYISAALDDKSHGHRALMKNGVGDSGFWVEGSWSYHSYALQAMTPLLEAARHCQIDLYDQSLRRMMDAPFHLSSPSGALPAFNDSYEGNVSQFSSLCEVAYARYQAPVYLTLLKPEKRSGEDALLYGVDDLPMPPAMALRKNQNFSDSGYTILTKGDGRDATWLCLKYGPHGGGHGHPDKASFVLYARGQSLAIDPGMTLYGAPVHSSWYRTTLAHNTLVVHEKSQSAATGKSLAFGENEGASFAMVDAGRIYAGVRFVRSVVLLDENHLVFVDQIAADSERTLDLAYHQRGEWDELPLEKEFVPAQVDGYRHIMEAKQGETADGVSLLLSVDKSWKTRLTLAKSDRTSIIAGLGIGSNPKQQVPITIFRRQAKQTVFLWGLSLDGSTLEIEPIELVTKNDQETAEKMRPASACVRVNDQTVWLITANPVGGECQVTSPDKRGHVIRERLDVRRL